jgi:pteridine reductase
MKFKDKNNINSTVLITGGAKRIGKEIAIFFAEKNFNIVIHYNHSHDQAVELQKFLIDKFNIKVDLFKANLFDQNQADQLANFMIKNYDNWNMLINNASIFNQSNFSDENYQKELIENFNVHVNSPIILIKKFHDYVKKNNIENAQIINLLDKNIVRYDTKYFYYLLTKKFLAESTKMIALEIAPQTRINGLAIGYTIAESDDQDSIIYEKNLINKIPLRKKCDQQNINQTIDYLIKNNFITGQIISIDGGSSLNHAG